MGSNRLFNTQRFNRVVIAVLLVWIASAALGIYLLTRFDTLIHSQLYNYGLQFDHAWADTYYLYAQLMYIALGVPMALSFVSIAAGFKRKTDKSPGAPKLEPKLAQPRPQPTILQQRKTEIYNDNRGAGITCPNCEKVFSRPLVMLNFESGKNKLVNVCPYCNHMLGNAENEKSSKNDFQIADSDKKLTH
jgi:uncharacterized Zn-finger protein